MSEPTARPDVLYRRLVDGGLVYDARSGQIHHLNETAAFIWEACAQGTAAASITQGLCARYEVGPDEAHQQVTRLLAALSRAGLVT